MFVLGKSEFIKKYRSVSEVIKQEKKKISLSDFRETVTPSHSASLLIKASPGVILLWKDKLHKGIENKMMTQA